MFLKLLLTSQKNSYASLIPIKLHTYNLQFFRKETPAQLFPVDFVEYLRARFLLNNDDDRRLVTSDVTAYVHKNQIRIVQFPFKVRISKGDDVKRIISDKPVWGKTSQILMSLNFRLFHWVCTIFHVSTPLKSANPIFRY